MRIPIVLCLMLFTSSMAQASQPNVLFIAVDDLRVELGCYGDTHVKSPNIDRLASQGTLFQRAYCQQTVCNPSRASLLTGLRPDSLRVWDLPTHFRENQPNAVTLPQLFMNNGYHTQCVGKIFHNWRQDEWKGDPASWSVPSALHYNTHGNDQPIVEGEPPPNLASGDGGLECRDVPDEAYFDGRIASTAVDALEAISQNDKPFFLAVGFWKPHTPFNAPKKYWDIYDRQTIPVPQHVTPPHGVPDIALTSSRYNGAADSDQLREMHHGHLAAISYLDAQIGKVLARLDELGLRKNTIVVFWSDHGLHLGEHGLTRKSTAFELDAHVPLIISSPKHEPGQRTDALVELLDLYPTLAEMCELDAPSAVEGASLTPILIDPHAEVKDIALTQTPRPNYLRGEMPKVMGYSARTDRYRYVEWRDFSSGAIQVRELYDHKSDPQEMTNLAGRGSHASALAEHHRLLEQKLEVVKESGPHQSSSNPVRHAKPNFVVILADDLGYGDLGCYGSTVNETPHIDALAQRGVRFTDFHSAGPMCSPTRAAMLTGQYQQRFGRAFDTALSGVTHRHHGLPHEAITIAETLRKQAYATACFGKWHLGYQPPWLPNHQGFDVFRGLGSGDGDFHTHIDRSGREDWWHNDQIEMADGYTTDLLTQYSTEFIKSHRDQPFLLYVPHLAIHFPWQGPNDPPHRRQGVGYHDDKWGVIPNPDNVAPHVKAMIESLDQSVGAIVESLQAWNLDDRTMVILTSDNGGYLTYGEKFKNISSNGPLRGQKTQLYEGGHRVPAIISWPGRIKPSVSSETAHSTDLLPTLAKLAGVDDDSIVTDGVDLNSHLFDGKPLPERILFWRTRSQSAVREGPWKLIRNGNRTELYNLDNDLGELENLAAHHPQRVRDMQQAWNSWQADVNRSAEILQRGDAP